MKIQATQQTNFGYSNKLLIILILMIVCSHSVLADEVVAKSGAEQIVEMTENKVILNIQKQPLNETSKQKIVLKKNWFVVNININGKVKVNPLTNTYEVE